MPVINTWGFLTVVNPVRKTGLIQVILAHFGLSNGVN